LRLTDALKIIRKAKPDAEPFSAALVCGCAPLHLKTFLHAHLQQTLLNRLVTVSEGLYGDLCGTLERLAGDPLQGIALVIEWSDLDARLGYRSAGRWTLAGAEDIVKVAEASLERLGHVVGRIAPQTRIAVSLPTLPLPPLFHTAGWQASELEILLDQQLASFSSLLIRRRGLSLVNARRLAEASPPSTRFDLKSELLIGFPYSMEHADVLAAHCARLLAPPSAKKGIITDLDETLWHGIAGEVGPDGVSWDLSQHHHLHALYQNLLSSLSEQGVLLGVASKNDAGTVEQAFQRNDILLKPERVFPFEVHWQAKSGSVGRILETWNIGADSVIFVDDSPMELAEVAASHPGIHCIQFPQGDYAAGLALLREIRDLCGKERISQEDGLRLDSIRQGAEFRRLTEDGTVPESFLQHVESAIIFDFSPPREDSRVLELVNKTNQFNLNGLRRTEADWHCQGPAGVVAVLSYEDKFGPLGKIAVLQGRHEGSVLRVATWVMSCRAFSRRVEHQCLKVLFERFDVTEIKFDFAPTAKNGPLQDFFASLLGDKVNGTVSLTRQEFEAHCPALFHRVVLKQ
jgi:FkbH-like protein